MGKDVQFSKSTTYSLSMLKTILCRFGKITKREKTSEKKDKVAAEKMTGGENMRHEEEEQRIDETIRILQGVLLRGRKYSRFA